MEMESVKTKTTLPSILGVKIETIGKLTTVELKDLITIVSILSSNTWSYSCKRGKYGKLTCERTSTTYRIEQTVFEELNNLIR